MPNDDEAEKAVIASIILDNGQMPAVAEVLEAADMHSPLYRRIYAAMLELFGRGEKIDPILIGNEMKKDGPIDTFGGVQYIMQLLHGIPPWMNLDQYLKVILDKSTLRKLIRTCGDISNDALSGEDDADAIVDRAEQLIFSIANQPVKGIPQRVDVLYEESIAKTERIITSGVNTNGVLSGLVDLDALTGGAKNGDLIIVAARPSMGKTAAAIQWALEGTRDGSVGVIFSLEMSKEQLMARMIASEAGIDVSDYMRAKLPSKHWSDAKGVGYRFKDRNLYIDDPSTLTPMQIMAKSRRLFAEHKRLDFIVVDYLQLMSASKRTEGRRQEVESVSRDLKAVAKELNVPVIALSQLSRSPEARNPPRPIMSDLRESGSIEQDADIVIFLYREEYYKQTPENAGLAEFILAKQRNGPTGTVTATFRKEQTRFENYYQER